MARHRSFVQSAAPKVIDPITFDLSGAYFIKNPEWPGPSTEEAPHDIPEDLSIDWAETFTCVAAVPAVLATNLRGSMVQDESGARIWHAGTIFDFFDEVIIPADLPRFKATLTDPKRIVQITVLVEIYQWLQEEYASFSS